VKTRDLAAEMLQASAAMTRADVAELVQHGVPPAAPALARLREENARQLRRRQRLAAIFPRGSLRPILELLEELIRHGLVPEAELDRRLAAYAELDPAALKITGGDVGGR
jgi:hypothetical protein